MLKQLSIRNYAIIRQVDVEFRDGLNIITGETGAGKSIVVGALGLVLGERADTSVLGDRSQKCTVEAHLVPRDPAAVQELLRSWEMDANEEEMILRREIAPNGKSRAFLNDTPVNLSQLRQFASALVDMHQQFDAMEIGDHGTQFNIVDALAGNHDLVKAYGVAFHDAQEGKRQLDELRRLQDAELKESDYTRFLFDELEEEDLKEGELEKLESDTLVMEHAEELRSVLGDMASGLQDGDRPVLTQVKAMLQSLSTQEKYMPALAPVIERLRSSYIELQDIAGELERIQDGVRTDGAELARCRERLDKGNRLLRKHGVKSTDELLRIHVGLQKKLDGFQHRDAEIADLEKKTHQWLEHARQQAAGISARRKSVVKGLEAKVAELLTRVGMPSAKLKVDLVASPLNAWGADEITFLFDANRSGRFEPVQKIASGGELSRLMLVVKSIVAGSMEMPTLIFDEIDSGISGEAAKQVGLLMKELSARHQVISITHQPQIAARADHHLFVFKKEGTQGIETRIRLLDDEGRVEAIARMLGGEKPTAIVLENAREMVKE